MGYEMFYNGAVTQLVECHSDMVEVGGSSPPGPTILETAVMHLLAEEGIRTIDRATIGPFQVNYITAKHLLLSPKTWSWEIDEYTYEIVLVGRTHGVKYPDSYTVWRIDLSDPAVFDKVKKVLSGDPA